MNKRYNPLRVKLDLTQQELAHFLQLPLSTVAMCERGKRTWPTKGLLRLARLELAWVAAENLPVDDPPPVRELVKAIGQLKNRMKECLERAGLLQKRLDSMKTLSLLLKTKEKTLQLLSEPGTSSIHQGWVEIQQYEIGKPLAENSLAKQIMIEHQVQTLQAEAAAAAATIERLELQMGEEPLNTGVEEGTTTTLRHEAVETREAIFMSMTETPLFQKQDTVISPTPNAIVEPPGFDLCLKRNCGRTWYHRTTSTRNTPRRRLLQRNLSRRLFHQQPRRQTTEHQHCDLLRAAGCGQIAFSPHKSDEFLMLQEKSTESIRDSGVKKSSTQLQVFREAHKLPGLITVPSSDSMLQVKNTCSGVLRVEV